MPVHLSVLRDGAYEPDRNDEKSICDHMTKQGKRKRPSSVSVQVRNQSLDDGRLVLQMEPEINNTGNQRSNQMRRCVVFET